MDTAANDARVCTSGGARMSASLAWTPPLALAEPIKIHSRRWLLLATTFVVGLAFFVAEHDLRVSLAEAYTQNAEEMELAAAGGNAIRRVAFLALAAWGIVLLIAGRQRLIVDWPLVAAIGLLLSWTAASCLWAQDAGMCLRRLLVLGCSTIAALGIARQHSLRELCWLVVGTLGTLAIVGIFAEVG